MNPEEEKRDARAYTPRHLAPKDQKRQIRLPQLRPAKPAVPKSAAPKPAAAEPVRPVRPAAAEAQPVRTAPVKADPENVRSRARKCAGKANRSVPTALTAVLLICSLIGIGWIASHLHIASAAESAAVQAAQEAKTAAESGGHAPKGTVNLINGLTSYVYNAKSDALVDLAYIRKIYTIEESAVAAPKPDPNRFGTTTNPEVIRALIDESAELLEGQETIWNESIVPLPGSSFGYYADETILVITWKELINGRACCCAEVKIADASQLRRKITEDTYDSGIRAYATELAAQTNAVLAMNADFYAFRNLGITVYQRKLYRFSADKLDTCFFNTAGEMVMVRAGELTSREETEQFIADNDILFSLAFGPVLIEDGVEQDGLGYYPIGEVDRFYSRSSIGMTGPLHYFAMTINYDGVTQCATLQQLADILAGKGLRNAYALDGGQTAEILLNGEVVNYIDWNAERQVSDILYFATALPASETGVAE